MTVEAIVLGKLKLDESNTDIALAIAEAETQVRMFCNIPDDELLPERINFTLANMAIGVLGINKYFAGDENAVKVELKSVTMGDTSYTFNADSKQQALEQLLTNYERDLMLYRRLRK